MPFGTQQAFFSRVELVAPVDDWRASRCVARCPACWFFFVDAAGLRAGLWSSGAASWSLHKAALPALAQGCNVVLLLRTLELVVTRDAVVKGAPKFCVPTQCASSAGAGSVAHGRQRGTVCTIPGGRVLNRGSALDSSALKGWKSGWLICHRPSSNATEST